MRAVPVEDGRNHARLVDAQPRAAGQVVTAGDDVRPVTVQQLPFISNGPFHTNTCEALRRSAERTSNDQVSSSCSANTAVRWRLRKFVD